MNRKSKGTQAEREIIHLLWGVGWGAIRAAGSGSSQFPSPDILAGNKIRRVAIECKTSRADSKYLPKEEIDQLKNFSSYFGSESWIAIKFFREQWYFLNLEDLRETEKCFVVSKDLAKLKGLSFEEFTGEGLY